MKQIKIKEIILIQNIIQIQSIILTIQNIIKDIIIMIQKIPPPLQPQIEDIIIIMIQKITPPLQPQIEDIIIIMIQKVIQIKIIVTREEQKNQL